MVYISEYEVYKGEEIFDSTLISYTHNEVPCLVFNLRDETNSSINYRMEWSGTPIHAGIINPLAPDLWTAQGNPNFNYTKPLNFGTKGQQGITLLACNDLMYITGTLKLYRENILILNKEIDIHI